MDSAILAMAWLMGECRDDPSSEVRFRSEGKEVLQTLPGPEFYKLHKSERGLKGIRVDSVVINGKKITRLF